MVDSRQKGARAELQARDLLRKYTGLGWERVPSSGALNEKHGLKGDLYVPNKENVFCVEVKHYAEDQLTSKVLTSPNPKFIEWWEQTVREADQVKREPMLIFKYDRSKWFVASHVRFDTERYIKFFYKDRAMFIGLLEDLLKQYKGWMV